jgi:hypothetical protein
MADAIDISFSDTLLGVFLGLSIASAFDHFFSRLDAMMTIPTIVRLAKDQPGLFLLRLFQLAVFFIMLSRFYLGAYRYSKIAPSQTITEALIDTGGVFLLFAGFYVASIVVRNTDLFYWIIVFFLAIDLIWFFTTGRIRHLTKEVRFVTNVWIFFDMLTILAVSISMLYFPNFSAEWIALSSIFLISLWDVRWLRHFYWASPYWAAETVCIRRCS